MKKITYLFILIITIISFVAGYKAICITNDYQKNEKIYHNILNVVKNQDKEKINFDGLLGQNSDFIGWIVVNGTSINYPVVQAKNNDYYLNHSFDNSLNSSGWIYMDARNHNDFSDKNTIIYGHSMLNKTMFYSLRNVLTNDWLNNSDRLIYFYTKDYIFIWQVFSVYTTSKESYYLTINPIDYNVWSETIVKRSLFNLGTININDIVLTLSSCYDNNDVRMVLHAKLVNKKSKC